MEQIFQSGQDTYWDIQVGPNPNYGDPYDHASRLWIVDQINGESVLEIGFGAGKDYQNLVEKHEKTSVYRGYDYCHTFVEMCQRLYARGDFRQADATGIPEQVSSWDTVVCRHAIEHTHDWRRALREAFRVARRRLIVITWQGLSAGSGEIRREEHHGGYNWLWGEDVWNEVLHELSPDVDHHYIPASEHGRENWAWVIWKNDVCFDLDDFCLYGLDGAGSRWEELKELKAQFPQLKVTLFAIPALSEPRFLKEIAGHDWIELAVHGFTHEPNTECESWTVESTHAYLSEVEKWDCFVKGFRAPGWRINPQVCQALKERGYWLAHHVDHKHMLGDIKLPVYWSHHPWMVHGHMQEIHSGNVLTENGLTQLCKNGPPFHENIRFHFASEMVIPE